MRIVLILSAIVLLYGQNYCGATNVADSLMQESLHAQQQDQPKIYNQLAASYLEKNIDSLKFYATKALSLAQKQENFYEEANALLHLGYADLNSGDRKSAYQFYTKAEKICTRRSFSKTVTNLHHHLGTYYYDGGLLDSALRHSEKARTLALSTNNSKALIPILNNIGNIHWYRGNYSEALRKYLEAYQKATETGNHKTQCSMLINIGNIYIIQKRYKEALIHFEEASSLGKKYNLNSIVASSILNSAIVNAELKEYPEALRRTRAALKIYQSIGDNKAIAISYHNIGDIHKEMGDLDLALIPLKKALTLNTKIGNYKSKVKNLENLAEIQIITKKYVQAKASIQEGLAIAKELKFQQSVLNLTKIKSSYYEALGQYKKALNHRINYEGLKDSIFNKTNSETIAELQTQFESEKKEKENELLRIKNNLVNVQLDQQKKVRNYSIAFGITALILSLIILGLLKARIRRSDKIKRFNQELEIINQKLETANAAKDKFFSIIAHDLRSPFNAILGFSDLLDQEMKNGADMKLMQEYNSCMNESSHKLFKLLENMLEWAYSQKGNLDFSPEVFDLYELTQIILEIFNLKAQDKGIQLVSAIQPGTKVFGDKNMINTVLRNLINNALKFTNTKGTVEIFTSKVKDILDISVKDDGIGISKENQTKLFKIDSNYTSTGTHKEQGTGLGLILCKEFIDKHGGRIWVQSQPNMGSIFSFSLKLGNSQNQSAGKI